MVIDAPCASRPAALERQNLARCRTGNDGTDTLGRRALHIVEQMAVAMVVTGVACPSSAPMTGSDRPDETARGIGVPQIMQVHVGDVRGLAQPDPRPVDVRPMATTASGENPLGMIGGLLAHLRQQLHAAADSGTRCSVLCFVVRPA